MHTEQDGAEAVAWATRANLIDAPSAKELPYAQFESNRNYRPCDLQVFVDKADQVWPGSTEPRHVQCTCRSGPVGGGEYSRVSGREKSRRGGGAATRC